MTIEDYARREAEDALTFRTEDAHGTPVVLEPTDSKVELFARGILHLAERLQADDVIEAGAKGIHDSEFHPGAWEDYDTWQINTEGMHETYRARAREALTAMLAHLSETER